MALLSLFALVAKDNPALLEPSIHQLSDGLTSQATAHSTLQVFSNMAMTRPQPLADHTVIIKRTAENFPKTAMASIQLMCLIAKTCPVSFSIFSHTICSIFMILICSARLLKRTKKVTFRLQF